MSNTGAVGKVGESQGQVQGSGNFSATIFQRSKSLNDLNKDNSLNKINPSGNGTEGMKLSLTRSLSAKLTGNTTIDEQKVKQFDSLKKGVEQIGKTAQNQESDTGYKKISVKDEVKRINNLTQPRQTPQTVQEPEPQVTELLPSENENVKQTTTTRDIEDQPVVDGLSSASRMVTNSGKDIARMFNDKPVSEPKLTLGQKIKKFFGPSANKQERNAIKSEFNAIAKDYNFGLSKEEKISKKEAIKGFIKDNAINIISGGAAIGLGSKSIKDADKLLTDLKTKSELTRNDEKFKSATSDITLAGGIAGAAIGGGIGVVSKGVSFITNLKAAVESGLEAKDFDKIAKELKTETKGIDKEIKELNKILKHTKNPGSRQELIAKRENLELRKEALQHASGEAKAISKELKLNTAEKTLTAGANVVQIGATLTGTSASLAGTIIAHGAQSTLGLSTTIVTGAVSGAASGVVGVIDIGIGTVGIAKDSHSFVKNAKLKYDAVKFSENPAKAVETSYQKKLAGLEKQLKKLDKKGNSEEIRNQKLKIQESIGKVTNKLVDIRTDVKIFENGSPEAKMAVNRKYAYTENISAITTQTISRRGLGYKALGISNNTLKVTAGVVSTGGTIATATGVGAPVGAVMTPVGWGLSATSSVNSIMLNIYKLKTTLTRANKAGNLQKQYQAMNTFTANLEDKLKSARLNVDISKNNSSSGIDVSKEQVSIKTMEADLAKVNKLKARVEVQLNKKDPKFAINSIINTLNKKAPPNATPEEKEKIRAEVVMVKAMLRNIYQVDPKSLVAIDPKDPQKASLEKIQKKAIKKLESKIQIFA
jgi:hypothetical protein